MCRKRNKMIRVRQLAIFGCLIILLFNVSCTSASKAFHPAPHTLTIPEKYYIQLLDLFPLNTQGYGPDSYDPTLRDFSATYALVLSSEARRWVARKDPESALRIRNAWQWLMDHSDLDDDGKPGWGLPFACPSLTPGIINPMDLPYTVTTAEVLEAMFDALELGDTLFDHSERVRTEVLIMDTWRRWSEELWRRHEEDGWFSYSPSFADDYFVLNVNGLMLSVAARALQYSWIGSNKIFNQKVLNKVSILTKTIFKTMHLREKRPYWQYISVPNRMNHDEPNDAVHHVFILWGLERIRDLKISEWIFPYTRKQAINSLQSFFVNNIAYDYPQDFVYTKLHYTRPMGLWGLGGCLAFLGEFRSMDDSLALDLWLRLKEAYGPWPKIRVFPISYSTNDNFYPRQAAFVLWGIACINYPRINSS